MIWESLRLATSSKQNLLSRGCGQTARSRKATNHSRHQFRRLGWWQAKRVERCLCLGSPRITVKKHMLNNQTFLKKAILKQQRDTIECASNGWYPFSGISSNGVTRKFTFHVLPVKRKGGEISNQRFQMTMINQTSCLGCSKQNYIGLTLCFFQVWRKILEIETCGFGISKKAPKDLINSKVRNLQATRKASWSSQGCHRPRTFSWG